MSLDEGVLREVLGGRPVANHASDQANHRALIAADDLLEGRLGARERVGNQPGFRHRLEIYRDGASLTKLTWR